MLYIEKNGKRVTIPREVEAEGGAAVEAYLAAPPEDAEIVDLPPAEAAEETPAPKKSAASRNTRKDGES